VGVQYFSKHQKALSKTELKKFLPLTTGFVITISLFYITMNGFYLKDDLTFFNVRTRLETIIFHLHLSQANG
jgi:hypothetical protein